MPLILSTLNCCRAAVVAWVGPPTRIGVVKKPTLGLKKKKTPSFHVSSCFPSCLSKSSFLKERYEDTESLPCLASQRSGFLTHSSRMAPCIRSSWDHGLCWEGCKSHLLPVPQPAEKLQSCDTTGCKYICIYIYYILYILYIIYIIYIYYIYIRIYVHIILVWFQKKEKHISTVIVNGFGRRSDT